ncbi:hypothetical protein MMC21_005378 [Puttea exsequens]|nr:hypothetical protein [Puttea exsequens]
MQYLISEGYPSAAQKFAHEANIQPEIDIEPIQDRVAIREAIHSGDIQSAIEKINEFDPEILDTDASLHFSLLRLQLIQLIRKATDTPNADITAALDFATTHLAPRAPTRPEFLEDLERTMALLIFDRDKLEPPLAALLDPALRQEIAREVNQALLKSESGRTRTILHELVNHRSWAYQKAKEAKKEIPDPLELGFNPIHSGHEISQNGTSSDQNGNSEAMATGWGPG